MGYIIMASAFICSLPLFAVIAAIRDNKQNEHKLRTSIISVLTYLGVVVGSGILVA